MTSIRSKLIFYFFTFILLFHVVSISIYISTQHFMKQYQEGFDRFLLLNDISQTSFKLYEKVNGYVVEKNETFFNEFHQTKQGLISKKEALEKVHPWIEKEELNKYLNMIETFILECEMTMGFVIRGDIEQYTNHLQEAKNIAYYIQETTLSLIDIELTDYQSFNVEMEERKKAFKSFMIYLFSTTVLLAVFFALWFSYGINKPIQVLFQAAKEVSAGKLDGDDVIISSNDELKHLGQAFNNMRQNIRKLIEEIKKKSELDRLLKELELKHLQNQINPHFLFNTLNTISRMAYLENANVTSRLIESVSSLLRHSLRDIKKSTTLREEVNVVKEYFYIQKTRFADRISFQVHIEKHCLDTKIPSLTIQPLVENAFIHGVEGKEEGGIIRLSIYETKEHVVVEVYDNGVGMSEVQVQALLKEENDFSAHTGHSTGIGIQNVIRRLKLFYQTEDVVQIFSSPNEGTTIYLLLPKEGNT